MVRKELGVSGTLCTLGGGGEEGGGGQWRSKTSPSVTLMFGFSEENIPDY